MRFNNIGPDRNLVAKFKLLESFDIVSGDRAAEDN